MPAPETAAALAGHENVAGSEDSSDSLESIRRLVAMASDEAFAVQVGSGSAYAAGLAVVGAGGVLALANVAPSVRAKSIDSSGTAGPTRLVY